MDNRQIKNGFLITSELIDSREIDNNLGLVATIDLKKAFDNAR